MAIKESYFTLRVTTFQSCSTQLCKTEPKAFFMSAFIVKVGYTVALSGSNTCTEVRLQENNVILRVYQNTT